MGRIDPYAGLKPGTELVHEGTSYFLTKRTPDRRFMAMSSAGAILTMPDPETGFPGAFPTVEMLRDAQRRMLLFIRSDPLEDPVRAEARAEETSPAEIAERDPWAPLRRLVIRLWNREPDDAKPPLSDSGLENWFAGVADVAEIKAQYGRVPCGSTQRTWITKRGRGADRRMVDMENRSGRVRRNRKIHPDVLAIGRLHAIAVAKRDKRRTVRRGHFLFTRDVARAKAGKPVEIDGAVVEFEKPDPADKRFKPFGREIFRLECHRARNIDTARAAWGEKGARAIYRGGGKAKEPTRFLEAVEQDDTPFPKWFVIDLENRVPAGPPTVVFTMDVFTRAFIGWDVSYEKPSISSWMRAMAHSALPKIVPERFAEDHPELADIGGYIVGYAVYDNALQNTARAVEEAGGDLCHEVRLAGEGEPTHKPHVERGHQTVQKMMGEVPGSTFDIALLRKYGYDPAEHVLVTIEEFRVLLAEAIATYHVTPSEALGGRAPLDVWIEQCQLHGLSQARDVDQFLRSIGDVDFYTFGRDGADIDGLDYSGADGVDPGNASLLADCASALGPAKNPDDPRFRLKTKTYPNDIGFVSVLNPLTRRLVDVPCTRQRYAAGKPKWLHDRAREHAAAMGLEFTTEEQMIEAHAGLCAAIEAIAPEAKARERLTMARLIDAPNVRRYLGSSLNVVRVKPSPTGMENTVEHDLRSGIRKDTMNTPPRSRRGGANVERDTREAGSERKAIADAARLARQARSGAAAAATAKKSAGKARKPNGPKGRPVIPAVPLATTKFK